jgi:uncharacterized membrane protein
MNNFIIILLLLLVIDLPVITTINYDMYKNQFERINNSGFIINNEFYLSCIIAYLLLAFSLFYFVLQRNNNNKLLDAFLLGFVIYGIYNSTNKATINKWGLNESIIDTLWGGVLFTIITFIMTKYVI